MRHVLSPTLPWAPPHPPRAPALMGRSDPTPLPAAAATPASSRGFQTPVPGCCRHLVGDQTPPPAAAAMAPIPAAGRPNCAKLSIGELAKFRGRKTQLGPRQKNELFECAVQPVLVKFKLASEAFSNSLRRSARTFLFSTDPENCKSTRFAPSMDYRNKTIACSRQPFSPNTKALVGCKSQSAAEKPTGWDQPSWPGFWP